MRLARMNFTSLAKSTPGVRNRTDCKMYLDYLVDKGLVSKSAVEIPSKSLRGAATRKYVRTEFYECTEQGKRFYDQFFPEEFLELAKRVIRRPNVETIALILQRIKYIQELGISNYAWIAESIPHPNRANLSKYLKLIQAMGMIDTKKGEPVLLEKSSYYIVTDKGEQFLSLLAPTKL